MASTALTDIASPETNSSPEAQSGPTQELTLAASDPNVAKSLPNVDPAPKSASTSFDTQPPYPSQSSAQSNGSKRIVSNGQEIVLNSDSDSDSLPDLDWGEPKPSIKVATPVLRSKRALDDTDHDLRKPPKKDVGGKKSFNRLIETTRRNVETERKIQEHKADLEKKVDIPVKAEVALSESMLGQVVGDDEDADDKAHRLFLAMQRTNATQVDDVYYFFEASGGSVSRQPEFPDRCLPDQQWAERFRGMRHVYFQYSD